MKFRKQLLTTVLLLSSLSPMAMVSQAHAQDAAGTGSLQILDTQKGSQYSIYKIFDATVDGDAVSYTIPTGSAIDTEPNFSTYFDTRANGGLVYVIPKQESVAQIAAWAQSLKGTTYIMQVGNTVTEDGSDTTETFSSLGYGYYLIDSTTATPSLAMITSVSPNGVIREKNTKPTWGDGGGKIIKGNETSFNVGEEVEYIVTYENAMNYNKNAKVYQYVLEDTLPTGVELNQDSIVVQVGDTTVTNFTKTLSGQNFKLVIPWAASSNATTESSSSDDFYYTAPQKITITYKVKVLESATEGTREPNVNSAIIYPNDDRTPTDPPKEVPFYSGEIEVYKVDATSKTELAGAEFVLKNEEGKFLKQTLSDTTITLNEFVENQEDATIFTTDGDGVATISGIKAGRYQLIEVKAPAGYNLLQAPVSVTLEVTDDKEVDSMIVEAEVENSKGVELPSTGGMGTTIFYVTGALLASGAVITAVVKKRLEAE